MRATATSSGTVRFGAFEGDLRAGELRKHGVKVKLQEQPFQVLQILIALDYEPLRSDERFAEMIRRVGLPQ